MVEKEEAGFVLLARAARPKDCRSLHTVLREYEVQNCTCARQTAAALNNQSGQCPFSCRHNTGRISPNFSFFSKRSSVPNPNLHNARLLGANKEWQSPVDKGGLHNNIPTLKEGPTRAESQ